MTTLKIRARAVTLNRFRSKGNGIEGKLVRTLSTFRVIESSTPDVLVDVARAIRATLQNCADTFTDILAECRIVHVLSKYVGWFHPDLPNSARYYARKGEKVKKGQVLCRIRALGHDDEIRSPVTGTLRRRYEKRGAPVDYERPLCLIEERDD